jgi:hypothetical protein
MIVSGETTLSIDVGGRPNRWPAWVLGGASDGVANWWSHERVSILTRGFDAGLFTALVGGRG